jgi:hypothetical protein
MKINKNVLLKVLDGHVYERTLYVYSLLLFISILCSAMPAFGNGAIWSPSSPSGVPRPIHDKDLLLVKEHVVMRFIEWDVNATFWIENPTKKDISVTMGFPIEYESYVDHSSESLDEYASQLLGKFRITVNGNEIKARVTKNYEDDYPVLFNWEMIFPANETTQFNVSYPIYGGHSGGARDNANEEKIFFSYVTHTGSYWAKPIGIATFEYCDPKSPLLKEPSLKQVSLANNGRSKVTRSLSLSPRPFRVDKERNCIVWERKNWSPEAGKDDIRIEYITKTEHN